MIVVLLLIIAVTLTPFLHVIAISLSNPVVVMTGNVGLIPKQITFSSYITIIHEASILRAYINTIEYAVIGTIITLVLSSMLGYSLSIKDYSLRKPISILLVITMYFGGGMIPTYIVIMKLGLIDTLWAMVLPNCISAFNIFIYRAFFMNIPKGLRESAKIDGANDIFILYKIIIPLSKPLLAVMALWSAVAIWSDFYSALLYLKDSDKYPLQMILRRILNQFQANDIGLAEQMMRMQLSSPATIKAAVIIFTSIPIICIYPFIQKYFTKGIMLGSIKG
jgi:putative aldouronate transport system permease protein